MNSIEFQIHVNDVCDSAEKFITLFYNKVDKSRHTIGGLLHQEANLLWNGHQFFGKQSIVSFFEKLPTTSTQISIIDAHPVADLPFLKGERMISILCGGVMEFGGKEVKAFTETFTLVSEGGSDSKVWKVISDTYRNL